MKKIYALPAMVRLLSPEGKTSKVGLLLLFLSLATSAFSQQKAAFGFVVKAGNFAIPHENRTVDAYYAYFDKNNAGSTYTLGIWQSVPLGKRFQISAELLYQNTFLSKEHRNWYAGSPGIFAMPTSFRQTQKIYQSSISIPLKLHFSLDKKGKTSLALGGGVSRRFTQNVHNHQEFEEGVATFTTSDYKVRISDWDAFVTNFQITAGLFHRLDRNTALGIEYTYERANRSYGDYFSSLSIFCDCLCDCGNQLAIQNTPKMNSFSVSLRHNILD